MLSRIMMGSMIPNVMRMGSLKPSSAMAPPRAGVWTLLVSEERIRTLKNLVPNEWGPSKLGSLYYLFSCFSDSFNYTYFWICNLVLWLGIQKTEKGVHEVSIPSACPSYPVYLHRTDVTSLFHNLPEVFYEFTSSIYFLMIAY